SSEQFSVPSRRTHGWFMTVSIGACPASERVADINGDERLVFSAPGEKMASDWSPDRKHLLYRAYDVKTGLDIWAVRLDEPDHPFAVVRTNFDERDAQFSPDRKWIAFQSVESGENEIYLQPFPTGPKQRISDACGAQVRWRSDGKELFYVAPNGVLTA